MQPPVVEPTANIGVALRALRDAGLRIGIVCDVGMAPSTLLRTHLGTHGLIDYFDHWSFSDEVGVFKPAAAIFEHALRGLGVDEPGTRRARGRPAPHRHRRRASDGHDGGALPRVERRPR